MNKKLYENFLITGISVSQYGYLKRCKELSDAGADATGIDPRRAKGQVAIFDEAIVRAIKAPVAQARGYMKSVTVPWTTSRNNDNGGRVSGNEYLLAPDKLVEYEERMSGYRMEWERLLERNLFSQWDLFRVEALTQLNGRFQEFFIPVEDLRKRFSWDTWIKPLVDEANIGDDIRLKAPSEVIDRCVEGAKREQAQKIANVIGGMADSVMDEANAIVKRIDEYVHIEGDNRKNTLPYEKGWNKLEDLADKIDGWRQALDDEDLTDAADKIRDLIKDIKDLGGGDLGAARSALSGEDDTERKNIRDKLTDITTTAAPATDRFDDFMGN
jgi:hypothetical protein|tara:strand:+ start:797 stop:1780 length:984 start_codon:yes stop_codon:yes gene_type:complete